MESSHSVGGAITFIALYFYRKASSYSQVPNLEFENLEKIINFSLLESTTQFKVRTSSDQLIQWGI